MASKKPSVRFDMTGLQAIASSLQKLDDSKYHVQVGIFGEKTVRKNSSGLTNAEVGFIHEMGSPTRGIPRRSFLLDTFTLHGRELEKAIAPIVDTLFKKGKIEEYLKQVSLAATNLVDEAFATGGWGAWPPDAYATVLRKLRSTGMSLLRRRMAAMKGSVGAHKGIDQTLIDTGQLAQSISARVTRG